MEAQVRQFENKAEKQVDKTLANGQEYAKMVKDGIHQASDAIVDKASQFSDQAKDLGEQALKNIQEQGSTLAKRVEESVKADPLKSVLMVAAAGFFVGWLLRKQ